MDAARTMVIWLLVELRVCMDNVPCSGVDVLRISPSAAVAARGGVFVSLAEAIVAAAEAQVLFAAPAPRASFVSVQQSAVHLVSVVCVSHIHC